jgi:hypothetical protein
MSLFYILQSTGQCLNFNCAWVLVLMLRQTITFLRTRGFGSVFPLDQHIYLHKVTGMLIAIFSFVHTIMHIINFSKYIVNILFCKSVNVKWTIVFFGYYRKVWFSKFLCRFTFKKRLVYWCILWETFSEQIMW